MTSERKYHDQSGSIKIVHIEATRKEREHWLVIVTKSLKETEVTHNRFFKKVDAIIFFEDKVKEAFLKGNISLL